MTKISGLELVRQKDGKLIFQPHEYVGKEPDSKFVYHQLRKLAERLGMHINLASFICSDEENGLERIKRSFYFSKVFATDIMGPMVLSQPAHVADNKGHSSNVFIFTSHIGMYKNKDDGGLLFGRLESERDGTLRPTCGALSHVMNRFLEKENSEELHQGDADLIGLLEYGLKDYKSEFIDAYNSGKDEFEKISNGMKYLAKKNNDVQVHRLIEFLSHNSKEVKNGKSNTKLVLGCMTINRYKYSDTQILTHAHLINGNKVIDLTKQAV